MNPNFRTVALIAAALGLIVSLFIALAPDDDDEAAPATTSIATTTPPATTSAPETTTAPTTTEPAPATTAPPGPVRFTVVAGGPIERGSVKPGRDVVIVVRSEVSDHAHLHGYDIMADVAPGQPAQIEFKATIPGQFELELEDRRQLIGVLEVRP